MSNNTRTSYLGGLRTDTMYPTYRTVVGTIAVVFKLLALLQCIGGVIFGLLLMTYSGLLGIVLGLTGIGFAVLFYFLAQCWQEAGLLVADLTDSVLSAGADGKVRVGL